MVVRRCQSCEPNDSDNDDADGDGGDDDDDTRTPRTIKPYFDNVDLSHGESHATAALQILRTPQHRQNVLEPQKEARVADSRCTQSVSTSPMPDAAAVL